MPILSVIFHQRLQPSHRGSPVALPGFSTLTGHREEPIIPLQSLDTAMYAIRAYISFALQPPQRMSGNKMDDPR